MITINSHCLVGSSTKYCWTQAQSLSRAHYTVSLVINLKYERDEGVIDLASIGGSIFEKFHEYGGDYRTPVEWQEFVKNELGELTEDVVCSTVIACIYVDTVWVWGMGETGASLFREGQYVTLATGGNWDLGISGKTLPNDTLIIGTSKGLETATSMTLCDAIQGGVPNYIETLAPLIHQKVDQAEIAIVALSCTTIEEDELQTNPEEKETTIFSKDKFPEIVINRMNEVPRRFNLIVGSIVSVGLIVLIITGAMVRIEKKAKSEYEETLTRSTAMIAEAESVAQSNPERAKILLSQSIELLEIYLGTEPKANYQKEAVAALSIIKSKEQEILRVRGIALEPTLELSILADGLNADTLVNDNLGSMYFWDDSSRSIVGVSTKDLSKVSFSVENERFIRPFSVSDNKYVGLASGGVWSGSKDEQKIVIPSDEEWGEISQIATFGNNIYLLDRGQGEIWKYAATDAGYGERKRWFGAGIILDLSKVVDWVVDGDIWLLTSSGKLEKYSRGAPAKFAMTGFPSNSDAGGFLDPIAVSIVDEKVYVLERGAKRVVALDISGQYLEQYVSEDFGRASDIMVYGGKGYVLVDNVVKEWGL